LATAVTAAIEYGETAGTTNLRFGNSRNLENTIHSMVVVVDGVSL
jgi:hypothetical protein